MSRNRSSVANLTWDEDLSGIQQLADNLRVMATHHIEYGILKGEKYPAGHRHAGMPVAEVATIHELGIDITERPFFTQSIPRGRKQAIASAEHLVRTAIHSTVDETDLLINANLLADTVREEIDAQRFASISEMTKKNKGRNEILRETDTMYESISGDVVKGKLQ